MTIETNAPAVGMPSGNEAQLSTQLSLVVNGVEIGFVESFNPSTSRQVQRLRELSSRSRGRVVEMVPHTEDSRISLTGFVIYKDKEQYLFRRVPQNGGNNGPAYSSLLSQTTGFDLVETNTHPATGVVSKTTYKDCWGTDWSKTVNIGNALVNENLSCEVKAVIHQ